MSSHNLLILIINQHLIFGIFLNVEHFLLLIIHRIMPLRKRAMLLIWHLLLWLLLILHLHLGAADGFVFVDLWGGLTILLNQHRRINLTNHIIPSCHIHLLLGFFDPLRCLLPSIFREWHSHTVLTLTVLVDYALVVGGSLGLGDFLVVAGANTLSTPDMLRMHQIAKTLALAIFYL